MYLSGAGQHARQSNGGQAPRPKNTNGSVPSQTFMSAKLRTWTGIRGRGHSWNGRNDPAAEQGTGSGQKSITDFFSVAKKAKKG